MGFESSPPPKVDYEAQTAQLIEANPDAVISHKGVELPLKTFVQMYAMCDRKFEPGVDVEKEMVSSLTNIVAEGGLIVPEGLQHFVKPKETADKDIDKLNSSPIKDKNKPVENVKTDADVAPTVIKTTKLPAENKPETAVKLRPVIHPEIMAQVVKLEIKPADVKPVIEKIKPIEQPPIVQPRLEKTALKTILKTPVKKEEFDTASKLASTELVEIKPTISLPTSEIQTGQSAREIKPISTEVTDAEYIDSFSEDILYVPVASAEAEVTITETETALVSAELTTEVSTEVSIQDELSDILNQVEVFAEAEKTPAVVAAEFMIQVFPAVTQEAYERVQVMEPVEAAEVAAQIETISIVADRLHELVVQGKTDGEEAQQIEAYLKREYEQLLVSVGIEPTQEILNEFIRYVYSAEYQIQANLNMNDVEVIDEGTHEKKLFDEQGVFARARAASVKLSRRLDKTIGRLVVNYSNL